MEINILKTDEEKKQYSSLCKYCFIDTVGWSDHIFGNSEKGETAYGAFDNGTLRSGVICKYYTVRLFEEFLEMAGISAVASYPEVRNKGYIRSLMKTALRSEYRKGYAVSALYPFSFAYYRKFGYGDLSGFWNVTFSPADIISGKHPEPLTKYDGSEQMFSQIQRVKKSYYTQFDFGALPGIQKAEIFNKEAELFKRHVYLAFEKGEPVGTVSYSLEPTGEYESTIKIGTLAYTSSKGLTDIMSHLAAHRDQCSKINGDIHPSVPLHLFTREPRIHTFVNRSWMARPLNMEKVLNVKRKEGIEYSPLTFSVKDPVIEEETATYTVTPDSVTKEPYRGENDIPLPLFSSLLFGGITPEQAFHSVYPQQWLMDAAGFFRKKRAVYLNEHF